MQKKELLLECFVFCLGGFLLFAMPLHLLIAWIADAFLPDDLYPIAFKVEFAIEITFTSLFLLIIIICLFGETLFETICQVNSKVLAICVTVITVAFITGILFLGITHENPYWITLNYTDFSQHEVFIAEGGTVHFVNPATGITQQLCLATHSECTRDGYGPERLKAPGVAIPPVQTLYVTFPTSGDYRVISITKPHMVLIIHVDVYSNSHCCYGM